MKDKFKTKRTPREGQNANPLRSLRSKDWSEGLTAFRRHAQKLYKLILFLEYIGVPQRRSGVFFPLYLFTNNLLAYRWYYWVAKICTVNIDPKNNFYLADQHVSFSLKE